MRQPVELIPTLSRETKKGLCVEFVLSRDDLSPECVENIGTECIVLAQGVGAHAAVASRLACHTAIWAYQQIRQKSYYWDDKKLLLQRIFRTTALTLWQKKRETGFSSGIFASLLVALATNTHMWIGYVGELGIIHLRSQEQKKIFPKSDDAERLLGSMRYGVKPTVYAHALSIGESVLLGTHGVLAALPDRSLARFGSVVSLSPDTLSVQLGELLNRDIHKEMVMAGMTRIG